MPAAKQGGVEKTWFDGVCEQLGEQMAVVNSQVEGNAMKAFTKWNIDIIDEAMQTRNKFNDDEEAIAWRRFTQKDIDEEWCFITSDMEKKLLCKHDVLEDRWKDKIGMGNRPELQRQSKDVSNVGGVGGLASGSWRKSSFPTLAKRAVKKCGPKKH